MRQPASRGRSYDQSGTVCPGRRDPAYKLREGGRLCDIVPTLIELMGLEKPKEMTGESLLVK